MSRFESVSEQPEAKRLLEAAVVEGPVHAYLFHGPAGVGKRSLARAFALELLGTARSAHPDLYPERVVLLDGTLPPKTIAEQVREQVRGL